MSSNVSKQTYTLPEPLAASVKANLADWGAAGKIQRLWKHDASLWTGTDEADWLGWLQITEDQIAHLDDLLQIQGDGRHPLQKRAARLRRDV